MFRTLRKSNILKIVIKPLKIITINVRSVVIDFTKAFQIIKILTDNVDKLIIPMEITGGALNTQFHDKADDHKTLQYNDKNCRLEE